MSETEVDPDWLASARWRYLNDPEFHAFVEIMVKERLAKERERD